MIDLPTDPLVLALYAVVLLALGAVTTVRLFGAGAKLFDKLRLRERPDVDTGQLKALARDVKALAGRVDTNDHRLHTLAATSARREELLKLASRSDLAALEERWDQRLDRMEIRLHRNITDAIRNTSTRTVDAVGEVVERLTEFLNTLRPPDTRSSPPGGTRIGADGRLELDLDPEVYPGRREHSERKGDGQPPEEDA